LCNALKWVSWGSVAGRIGVNCWACSWGKRSWIDWSLARIRRSADAFIFWRSGLPVPVVC